MDTPRGGQDPLGQVWPLGLDTPSGILLCSKVSEMLSESELQRCLLGSSTRDQTQCCSGAVTGQSLHQSPGRTLLSLRTSTVTSSHTPSGLRRLPAHINGSWKCLFLMRRKHFPPFPAGLVLCTPHKRRVYNKPCFLPFLKEIFCMS